MAQCWLTEAAKEHVSDSTKMPHINIQNRIRLITNIKAILSHFIAQDG